MGSTRQHIICMYAHVQRYGNINLILKNIQPFKCPNRNQLSQFARHRLQLSCLKAQGRSVYTNLVFIFTFQEMKRELRHNLISDTVYYPYPNRLQSNSPYYMIQELMPYIWGIGKSSTALSTESQSLHVLLCPFLFPPYLQKTSSAPL